MKYFQEITEWDAGYPVPNHVYYMKDDKTKAVGYIPAGKKKLVMFSKPMTIESKGRKFVILPKKAEDDQVYFPKTAQVPPKSNAIEVEGSNGKKYYITKVAGRLNCTCPGFTFRHTCKHVTNMATK